MTIEEAIGAMGVGEWGVGALILLFIIALVTGKLVPAKTLERLISMWKQAYENERAARIELQKTLHKFADGAETTNHLLESLPKLEDMEEEKTTAEPSSRFQGVMDALRRGRNR